MSLHPDSDALSGGEVQSIMNGDRASPGQAGRSHFALTVEIFRAGLRPIEQLGQGIDLIIVAAVREGEELGPEFIKPWRFRWQIDLPRFDEGGLRRHPHDFVRRCHIN